MKRSPKSSVDTTGCHKVIHSERAILIVNPAVPILNNGSQEGGQTVPSPLLYKFLLS